MKITFGEPGKYAIIIGDKKTVIEVKENETVDLGKINEQWHFEKIEGSDDAKR